MTINDRAKADWQRHTTGENGVPISLTNADSSETIDILGIATKHHLQFTDEGVEVNGKNAHVSFSEKQCTDLSFSIRNGNGEVDLTDFKVVWKDSTTQDKTYIIREWFQDETFGMIVCILGDYE